jgi:hypothetical protein
VPTTTNTSDGDHASGVYQSRLPLSIATLEAIRAEIVAYRREAKSRWGKKSAGQLTNLIAAVLFHDQRPADLAAPAGVSPSTVRRWLHRVIDRPEQANRSGTRGTRAAVQPYETTHQSTHGSPSSRPGADGHCSTMLTRIPFSGQALNELPLATSSMANRLRCNKLPLADKRSVGLYEVVQLAWIAAGDIAKALGRLEGAIFA